MQLRRPPGGSVSLLPRIGRHRLAYMADAIAGCIKAREDAFFQLPEVAFGLIPGAGGSVSLLPRIGRHRLAYMALTAARVDAATALSWGLVDEIVDSFASR